VSGWAIAFFVLLVWHFVSEFAARRLIYWQRRHIGALKEAARLDAQIAQAQRRYIAALKGRS
jgi:hypothetical protein